MQKYTQGTTNNYNHCNATPISKDKDLLKNRGWFYMRYNAAYHCFFWHFIFIMDELKKSIETILKKKKKRSHRKEHSEPHINSHYSEYVSKHSSKNDIKLRSHNHLKQHDQQQ